MADLVALEVDDGVLVVRRRADAAGAARLRAVGERLLAAAHAGVVPVVSSAAAGDGWELVATHGGHPLTGARARSPERLAAIGAVVATTLTDLHDAAVSATGGWTETTCSSVPTGAPCCAGSVQTTEGPTLLTTCSRSVCCSARSPMSSNRSTVGRRRCSARLRGVLEGATSDQPDRRPPARRLASALAALASPGATGVARRRRTPPTLLLVAAGLAVVAGALLRGSGSAASSGSAGTSASTSASTSTTSSTLPACVALVDARVTEPACGTSITVEDGAVVVDGVRSVVGRGGDEVAVGDWDCDGVPEPVVLRPASGEMLLFGPPDASGARSVVRSTRVPGAEALAVEAGEPGCASLGVVDAAGERTEIEG